MSAPATHDNRTCLTCGYSLRGLNESGVCPECGESIAASVRMWEAGENAPLELADCAWLRGPLRATVAMAVASVIGNFAEPSSRMSWHLALYVLALMLSAYALWEIAAKEPRGLPTMALRAERWLLRGSAIAMGLFSLWMLMSRHYLPPTFTRAGYVLSHVLLPATALYYLYLARLAGRLARKDLYRQAWGIAVLLPLSMTAVVAAQHKGLSHGLGSWVTLLQPIAGVGFSTGLRRVIHDAYFYWFNGFQFSAWAMIVTFATVITLCTAGFNTAMALALWRVMSRSDDSDAKRSAEAPTGSTPAGSRSTPSTQ